MGETPGAFALNLAVTVLPPVEARGADAPTRNATTASATAEGGSSAGSS